MFDRRGKDSLRIQIQRHCADLGNGAIAEVVDDGCCDAGGEGDVGFCVLPGSIDEPRLGVQLLGWITEE